jgi:cytochrome b561
MANRLAAGGRYNSAAMTIHWITALMVLGLLASGLTMGSRPSGDALANQILPIHASFGLTVLGLTLLRLGLRFIAKPPPLPEMAGWEKLAARVSHVLFYALLILMPMSGWVVVSVAPNLPAIDYFGLMDFPKLPPPPGDQAAMIAGRVMQTHEALALVMIGLLSLHIAAALRHALILKDGVLSRMLPSSSR